MEFTSFACNNEIILFYLILICFFSLPLNTRVLKANKPENSIDKIKNFQLRLSLTVR